ncbi:MDR family MFS transporter [Serinibacter arcticus]|uniref:Putative transport protein n=1 Tax=Serinibacter arcticus TaxID=1655435 RepID=A0A4Z1E1P4_9MICO|nr:MDR family MFS transporter [Serinibacter arcticus]TGO05786.1 putative transport protein [Serinibacter arcticus]
MSSSTPTSGPDGGYGSPVRVADAVDVIADASDAVVAPVPPAALAVDDAAPVPDRLTPANLRLLVLLLVSAFVVILNETTMGVALPPIMADFGITAATGQWLTTAFLLTMAVVIPTTGWLLGRLGTRRAYLLAMSAFTVGTALAAFAPSFELLLGARVVQASGTAIMMPLLMTTVMRIVPSSQRGRVMGNVSLVIAAAPALGPSASGFVLINLTWHWIFGLVLPIAIIALVCGARWVRDTSTPASIPLDIVSVPLAVVAFGGLVYGLSGLGEAAQSDPIVPAWVPIVVGALALGAFVWRQLALGREGRALLDVRVMTVREFSLAVLLMCLAMFAMFGVMLLLPLYLQGALGLTPLSTGLLMLPGALAMGLLGPVVGRVYDRIGPRPLVVPGLALSATGLVVLAAGPASAWVVLGGHVMMSLGMALVFTPMFTLALGSLTGSLVPHGSAAIGTLQQLAGAAGTAASVAILTVRETSALAGGASEVDAISTGAHGAFWVGAGVMGAAALAALMLPRSVPATPEGAAPVH